MAIKSSKYFYNLKAPNKQLETLGEPLGWIEQSCIILKL